MPDIRFNALCTVDLQDTQKEAFLQAFVKMAHIDEHFDAGERDFICMIARDLGLSENVENYIFSPWNEEQILEGLSTIKNRQVALEIIKELCLLAHTDRELSDEEMLFLGRIGLAMGVELEEIEAISRWVIDYIVWKEQGKIIFEEV